MALSFFSRALVHSCCAISLIAATVPASAADDTTQTGIIAGLGLGAAGGKTTAANGAGAIEAGILSSDAYNQAGAIIAAIVKPMAGGQTVLLIAHDDATNFNQPDVVLGRVDAMIRTYAALHQAKICKAPPKTGDGKNEKSLIGPFSGLMPDTGKDFLLKDVVGAALVDTTISPVTLTPSDRMLIDSILMHGGPDPVVAASSWYTGMPPVPTNPAIAPTAVAASERVTFVVPGEATAVELPGKSQVYAHYMDMLSAQQTIRGQGCDADEVKAAYTATDALVTSLNTVGDKAMLSPLLNAIQLEQVRGTKPLVLRVSVDQAGGTLLTRTGVIYSLGFPGAAVVSAGLLVSFRLANPATGQLEAVGAVRCITQPLRIRRARDAVENGLKAENKMACSYKVTKL